MPDGPVWTPSALAQDPHADADKARKVQAMFAAIAQSYDLNNRLHSMGQDQSWRRAAVRAANVDAGTHVLDVACGTGDLAQAFADAGAASVTGVDFTPEMLEIARHKALARAAHSAAHAAAHAAAHTHARTPGGAPRSTVTYEQGDAMALRQADTSVEVVSIAFGIRNVAQPARALAEFARVLRPGGRLVVLEFAEPKNVLIRWGSALYTRHIMPWTATLVARDRTGAYRYLPRSVSTFMEPAAFKQAMATAGFQQISDAPLSMGVCRIYRGVRPADYTPPHSRTDVAQPSRP